METGYPLDVVCGVIALHLDGCSTNGIARFLGMSRRTVEKYIARKDRYVISRAEFQAKWLRRDYSAKIQQRTADGRAGMLNKSPESVIALMQRR